MVFIYGMYGDDQHFSEVETSLTKNCYLNTNRLMFLWQQNQGNSLDWRLFKMPVPGKKNQTNNSHCKICHCYLLLALSEILPFFPICCYSGMVLQESSALGS